MLSSEACFHKKKPGAGTQTCSVKKGLRGLIKCPLRRQKALDAVSVGPCDPLAHKTGRQNPQKEGTNPPPSRGFPWPSLGRGAGEIPFTHFGEITYSGFLDKVWPHNKTKGEKKNKAREAQQNPCRLASQERGLRRGERAQAPRRIPKTRGAQNGTPKNHQEAGRTAKMGETDKNGGTQKKRNQQNKCVCGGVLLLPDLYLFKKKQKPKTTTTTKKTKEEKANPENNRPDIKENFSKHFREQTAKN